MKRALIPFRHATKVAPYEAAVRAGGIEPVPMSVSGAISLDGMSGLVLMGGTDVNPARFGEQARPETDQPDDERDRVELELIHEAIEKDLPILGICRGLQILNVYHGGTLIQHLPSAARHDSENANKGAAVHEVAIEPESVLSHIAGTTRWQVNSRHHQAANKVGAGLEISARDADKDAEPASGIIEGLERRDRTFVVSVQWHPEDQVLSFPEQLKLFQRFAKACG